MERTKKCCTHCHKSFITTRNPKQCYCSQRVCQNTRKREWRKQKHANDSDYRQNQRRAEQSYQRRHPDYWRNYRATHPNYAKRNREQQRIRKRQQLTLANSDALLDANTLKNTVEPGFYRMVPVTNSRFANSDALIVSIAVVARV